MKGEQWKQLRLQVLPKLRARLLLIVKESRHLVDSSPQFS